MLLFNRFLKDYLHVIVKNNRSLTLKCRIYISESKFAKLGPISVQGKAQKLWGKKTFVVRLAVAMNDPKEPAVHFIYFRTNQSSGKFG